MWSMRREPGSAGSAAGVAIDGDAVAVARRRGDDEKLDVRVAVVDRLMRRAWWQLEAGASVEAVARALHLHRERAGEHEEELPRVLVAVRHFVRAGRHP